MSIAVIGLDKSKAIELTTNDSNHVTFMIRCIFIQPAESTTAVINY